MKKEKTVRMAKSLCFAEWEVENINEKRLIALILSRIEPKSSKLAEMTILLIDIFGGKEYGGKNYKEVIETVDNIRSRVITIRKDDGETITYKLFDHIFCKGNLVISKLNDELKPYLLNLKKDYVEYSLDEFMSLSSVYSQKLYEYLKSLNKNQTIKIEDLHLLLGVPEIYQTNFAHFKKRVLDPSLKQINEKTGLKYRYEIKKRKNKVSQIIFTSIKRKRSQKDEEVDEQKIIAEILAEVKDESAKARVREAITQLITNKAKKILLDYYKWEKEQEKEKSINYANFLKSCKDNDLLTNLAELQKK